MRAGFYEVDITPPLGSSIPGYMESRFSIGVKERLYAKAAVLENNGTLASFLVIDAVDLPLGLPEKVRDRVNELTGMDRNSIMLASTHAHTAMPTRIDEFDDSNSQMDAMVIEMAALKAADAVALAYQRLAPVKVYYGMSTAEGISFVRQYHIKDGTVRTNPGYCLEDVVKSYTEPDTKVPVFIFRDENGCNVGSIASFALHHDTVTGEENSGDYSGVLAKKLKKLYGNDFVSIFYQGFCGDINHLDFTNLENELTTEQIADVLLKSYLEAEKSAELLADDALAVKMDTVCVEKRKVDPELIDRCKRLIANPPEPGAMTIADPYSDRMLYACARIVLESYDKDKRKTLDVPVQVIKIGPSMIYALPGEVFSQFGDKIRSKSPVDKVMTVSMAHTDDFGAYVPIPELFLPEVYESSIYSARFEPDCGDKMVDKAIEIAKKLV